MSRQSKQVAMYTRESVLRHPGAYVRAMWRDVLASRELAWTLFVRDLKAQYRQSLLGLFWAFVPAITVAVGLGTAKSAGIVNLGETNIPYPAYVLIGMTLWQTFTEALRAPMTGLNSAKGLLAKIWFPPESVVLAKLAMVFFNFSVKLILIAGALVLFQIPIGWEVIVAPVAVVNLVMFGATVGLFLAPLGALYSDVQNSLNLAISAWLFLTPVVFSPPRDGWYSVLVGINPVSPLLVTARELMTGAIISNPTGWWLVSSVQVPLLLMSWVLYRLSIPFIAERSSA